MNRASYGRVSDPNNRSGGPAGLEYSNNSRNSAQQSPSLAVGRNLTTLLHEDKAAEKNPFEVFPSTDSKLTTFQQDELTQVNAAGGSFGNQPAMFNQGTENDEERPTPRAFAETIQMSTYNPGATLPNDIHSGEKLNAANDYFMEEQVPIKETN